MPTVITLAVEGMVDAAVAGRVCDHLGLIPGPVYGNRGKNNLDKRLAGFNNAARLAPWLVLRDLDHDADCGPDLVRQILPDPAERMVLRVVVREVESWLLGDSERFSAYFAVPKAIIPSQPEELDDPKAEVIRLIQRSRRKAIRADMLPIPHGARAVGPSYASRMAEFAETTWRPDVAAMRCDSLRRCIQRLREWA